MKTLLIAWQVVAVGLWWQTIQLLHRSVKGPEQLGDSRWQKEWRLQVSLTGDTKRVLLVISYSGVCVKCGQETLMCWCQWQCISPTMHNLNFSFVRHVRYQWKYSDHTQSCLYSAATKVTNQKVLNFRQPVPFCSAFTRSDDNCSVCQWWWWWVCPCPCLFFSNHNAHHHSVNFSEQGIRHLSNK